MIIYEESVCERVRDLKNLSRKIKKKRERERTIGEPSISGMRCTVKPRMSNNKIVYGRCEIRMIDERTWARGTTDRKRWISVVVDA